jgi:hypothetical protein
VVIEFENNVMGFLTFLIEVDRESERRFKEGDKLKEVLGI